MQSWKCSDWMVSWIRWFSCGPTWTDGAEVEEDASFKPSSTFLMLNFFIFQSAEHRIKGGGGVATFLSLRGTHTHSGALSVLRCAAHMLALLPRRGLHRWEAVTRVSLTRGAGRGGGWDGSILGKTV